MRPGRRAALCRAGLRRAALRRAGLRPARLGRHPRGLPGRRTTGTTRSRAGLRHVGVGAGLGFRIGVAGVLVVAASGAGADGHIAQAGQHALLGQQRVQLLEQPQALHHHPAVEDPVEQQPRAVIELHDLGRMAHRAAQRLRAKRNALTVERGRRGQHAETLAEQMQDQVGARFLARRDGVQHRALVHHRFVHQTEVAEIQRRPGHRDLARRNGQRHRLAQAGEVAFQQLHEARGQIVAIEPHHAQRVHVVDRGAAGVVGQTEELFLELGDRRNQIAFQILTGQRKRALQRAAHPARQPGGGQSPWRGGILWVGGRSHFSLGECDEDRVS